MDSFVLSADLGGTNLRMAVVDDDGSVRNLVKRPTPRDGTPADLVRQIREMGDECLADTDRTKLCAVAFTAPAPIPFDFDGVLTKLPNLPSLIGMDLGGELIALFDRPVVMENDATAAGIGENWIGAARGLTDVVCVTLGTGVGGGLIVNGEPIRGRDGIGGEIGHVCVEPEGFPCGCGSHGCIEQYASATAVVRLAREFGMRVATSKDVYDAFRAGDGLADAVFRSMGRYLGITLAGIANMLNPEMFVICGGLTGGWDAFAPHLTAEIRNRAYKVAADRARVVPGELDDNAGIIGAARSAFVRAANCKA